jgi:hypothetical protein
VVKLGRIVIIHDFLLKSKKVLKECGLKKILRSRISEPYRGLFELFKNFSTVNLILLWF